jgi:hypothetical protein
MGIPKSYDRCEVYQIRVKGILDPQWSDWFDGFAVIPLVGGETLLAGRVSDQAALHGLLVKIRDLGLPLLSLNRVEEGLEEDPGRRWEGEERGSDSHGECD